MFNENMVNSTPDLNISKNTSILSKRIFDCISLENSHVSVKTNAKFDIINPPYKGTNYKIDSNLYIKDFKLEYDSIAALFTPQTEFLLGYFTLCQKRIYPIAIPELIISKSTNFIVDPTQTITVPFGISNNFEFNINTNSLSRFSPLISQNIIFGITGLKITAWGSTSLFPFTAIYEPGPMFICYALDQPYTFDFFSTIKIPNYKYITLRETFNPTLYVRGINSTNSKIKLINSIYSFNADIESIFILKKTITSLIEESFSLLLV